MDETTPLGTEPATELLATVSRGFPVTWHAHRYRPLRAYQLR